MKVEGEGVLSCLSHRPRWGLTQSARVILHKQRHQEVTGVSNSSSDSHSATNPMLPSACRVEKWLWTENCCSTSFGDEGVRISMIAILECNAFKHTPADQLKIFGLFFMNKFVSVEHWTSSSSAGCCLKGATTQIWWCYHGQRCSPHFCTTSSFSWLSKDTLERTSDTDNLLWLFVSAQWLLIIQISPGKLDILNKSLPPFSLQPHRQNSGNVAFSSGCWDILPLTWTTIVVATTNLYIHIFATHTAWLLQAHSQHFYKPPYFYPMHGSGYKRLFFFFFTF